MKTNYHIVDIIDNTSYNHDNITYDKNYNNDYFIVDCIWKDENESTYIKLINNPLHLYKYTAFIKFIKTSHSSIAHNMLYKNLYFVDVDVNGEIHNYIYLASKTGVKIPNNSILRIKMYFSGSNKFIDIINEINDCRSLGLCNDFNVVPLSIIKSVKDNNCDIM